MSRNWKGHLFNLIIGFTARLARTRLHSFTRIVMRALGAFTLMIQRGEARDELKAVAHEWQGMFPRRDLNPIVETTNDTVSAEIHVVCRLRGTGDVNACYRMMEYDRRMLETIGGQLVVLRSQAEPGVERCKVAIRVAGAPTDDLTPAHL